MKMYIELADNEKTVENWVLQFQKKKWWPRERGREKDTKVTLGKWEKSIEESFSFYNEGTLADTVIMSNNCQLCHRWFANSTSVCF